MASKPNDRKDPRDANPMFKRLPAEVVSRRKQVQVMNNDDDEAVSLDRKAVFVLKPELRAKWLSKALKQAVDGKLRPNELYDVVASSRFAENLTPKVGRKMGRALRDQVSIFTSKQQKFIIEQAEIVTRFGVVQEESKDEDKKDSKKMSAIDEMMARVNAFVNAKQSENNSGDGATDLPAVPPTQPDHHTNGESVELNKPVVAEGESKQEDGKAKKDKEAKGKDEKKESKESKAGTKSKSKTNGKSSKRHSSSSSSSSRSRSKSRRRKKKKDDKGKDDKGSKKATSKKTAKSSSESSSSESSSSRSKERRKTGDKKKRRAKSSSSSSESSSKRRKKSKKAKH